MTRVTILCCNQLCSLVHGCFPCILYLAQDLSFAIFQECSSLPYNNFPAYPIYITVCPVQCSIVTVKHCNSQLAKTHFYCLGNCPSVQWRKTIRLQGIGKILEELNIRKFKVYCLRKFPSVKTSKQLEKLDKSFKI